MVDPKTEQGIHEDKEGNGGRELPTQIRVGVRVDDNGRLESESLTKGEKEMREARRRYVLAYLRCARSAVDEVGKLLADNHINEDIALEMMAEIKEMYF